MGINIIRLLFFPQSKVYVNKSKGIEQLKNNIRADIDKSVSL